MTMQEQFEEFDRLNPHVWTLWVRYALKAISVGSKRLSASLIAERIRWEVAIVTRGNDKFKLNNNYRAFYARKFEAEYPKYKGIFTRRASAADRG